MADFDPSTFVAVNAPSPKEIGGYPMQVPLEVQKGRDKTRQEILKEELLNAETDEEAALILKEIQNNRLSADRWKKRPVEEFDPSTFKAEGAGEFDPTTFTPEKKDQGLVTGAINLPGNLWERQVEAGRRFVDASYEATDATKPKGFKEEFISAGMGGARLAGGAIGGAIVGTIGMLPTFAEHSYNWIKQKLGANTPEEGDGRETTWDKPVTAWLKHNMLRVDPDKQDPWFTQGETLAGLVPIGPIIEAVGDSWGLGAQTVAELFAIGVTAKGAFRKKNGKPLTPEEQKGVVKDVSDKISEVLQTKAAEVVGEAPATQGTTKAGKPAKGAKKGPVAPVEPEQGVLPLETKLSKEQLEANWERAKEEADYAARNQPTPEPVGPINPEAPTIRGEMAPGGTIDMFKEPDRAAAAAAAKNRELEAQREALRQDPNAPWGRTEADKLYAESDVVGYPEVLKAERDARLEAAWSEHLKGRRTDELIRDNLPPEDLWTNYTQAGPQAARTPLSEALKAAQERVNRQDIYDPPNPIGQPTPTAQGPRGPAPAATLPPKGGALPSKAGPAGVKRRFNQSGAVDPSVFLDGGKALVDFMRARFGELKNFPKIMSKMSPEQLDHIIMELDKLPFEPRHPLDTARTHIWNQAVAYRMTRAAEENAKAAANFKDFKHQRGERFRDHEGNLWEVEHQGVNHEGSKGTFEPEYVMKNVANDSAIIVSEHAMDMAGWKKFTGPKGVPSKFGQSGGMDVSWVPLAVDQAAKVWQMISAGVRKTTAEYQKDFPHDPNAPISDIKAELGLSTGPNRVRNRLIQNLGTSRFRAYLDAMHIDNRMRYYKEAIHQINTMLYDNIWQPFDKWYGLGKLGMAGFARKLFVDDIKIRVDVEKNPSKWQKTPDQMWPTEAQYVEMGMSPGSAKIWTKVDGAFQLMYDMEKAATTMNKMNLPPQIPGYLPHVFKGAYRTVVEVVHKGLNGKPDRVEHLAELNAWNRKDQQKHYQYLMDMVKKSGKEGVTVRTIDPDPRGSNTGSILQGMWEANQRMENSKGLESLTRMIYEGAARGIVTTVLDRATNPRMGHLFERVGEKGDFGLTNKEIMEAAQEFQKILQNTTKWSIRAKFLEETLFPLEAEGRLNATNLRSAVQDRVNAFLEVKDMQMNGLSHWVRDFAIRQGWNPAIGTMMAHGLQGGFSKFLLFGSVPFYAVNALQSSFIPQSLLRLQARDNLLLGRSGDITKAYKDMLAMEKDILTVNRQNPIIDSAMKNGHGDAIYWEAIDPTKIHDPISSNLEKRTRLQAFVAGYHYYKQLMSHEDALSAAGKVADDVGVAYSSTMGAPVLFGKMDVLARPLTMFLTFTHHQFGLYNEMLQITNAARKQGNYKAAAQATNAFATGQLINMALFGLAGGVLMKNYEDIARWANDTFGTNLPIMRDLARTIDEKVMPKDLKGVTQYGLISKGLGYDISSSGQGPAVSSPTVFPSTIALAATSILMGAKTWLSPKPPTRQDWWKEVGSQMPVHYSGIAEYVIKNPHLGDVFDQMAGKQKDYVPETKDIAGKHGIERTVQETNARALFGLKSLAEREYSYTEQIDNYRKQMTEKKIANLTQRIREQKKITQENWREILALAVESKATPQQFIEALVNAIGPDQLPPDLRKAWEAKSGTPKSLREYKEWVEQRQREIDGGKRR